MLPRRFISKKIGEILVEKGIVTDKQIQEAIDMQKEKGGLIGNILISLGYVTEQQIAKALTMQFGFPYLPLSNYYLGKKAVGLIPQNIALKDHVIAVDKIGNSLTVAMSDPLNAHVVDELERITNCKIQIFLSTPTDAIDVINKYYL